MGFNLIIDQYGNHLLGASAALTSALCWSISAILFRQAGEHLSALAMNLFKGLVAIAFMGAIVAIEGFSSISSQAFLLLAASGLFGIVLGDTLYFMTLVRLGPRVTLLVGTLIPLGAALAAAVFLDEHIAPEAWIGVIMTLAGVTYVLWEQTGDARGQRQWALGILLGLLFVIAHVTGILFTKIGVVELSAMEGSLIRHAWAVTGLFAWGFATHALAGWTKPLKDRRLIKILFFGSLIGAFLGSWLSVVGLKYTDAAIAVTLNSTSPIFVLPIAALILKERISIGSVLGAILAVAGIGVYFSTIHQ